MTIRAAKIAGTKKHGAGKDSREVFGCKFL